MMIQALENNSSPSSPNFSHTLGKDVFFKLLVMQLTHQDPIEPMSNIDFVTQLAQFGSLEQLNNLNLYLESIFQAQLLYQGSQLLGYQVEGIDPFTGEEVRGEVKEVYWREGTCYLKIGDRYIPLSFITKVLSK
jgi:flagellar basal-body rod modification protein FlgD